MALRFLPVRCPIGPIELRHGRDFAACIGYSRGRGTTEGEREQGQAAATGLDMGAEKRAAAMIENIEGRTWPRVDFDQRIVAAFDKKIDAVETAKPARRCDLFRRAPQPALQLARQTSRAKAAAETKGFSRRRRRPLTAQSHDPRL